ncbi:MAG: 4'-phosphopantetheinyl transferase family protein [Bryobacteraceae bacterium]
MDLSEQDAGEDWSAPPVALPEPAANVHLWRVLLDVVAADIDCLSADERARADKLIHVQHRNRFVAMRSAVRSILSRYLETTPDSIAFAYAEKGKPSISKGQNNLDLRFNLSHSGGIGLLAITVGREVGVDVETRQEVLDFMAVARRFFAAREYRELSALPQDLRQRAFLRCWTRKEAYVKALGAGLACSLQSFSVSVSPDVTDNALLEAGEARALYVADVSLPDECFAAIALEGRSLPRCCWTYSVTAAE